MLVVGVAAVVVVLVAAAIVLGGAVSARHAAEAAADLSALAGAQTLQASGAGAACVAARRVGAENHAEVQCRVEGEEVVTTASVPVAAGVRLATGRAHAVARARAGPPRARGG